MVAVHSCTPYPTALTFVQPVLILTIHTMHSKCDMHADTFRSRLCSETEGWPFPELRELVADRFIGEGHTDEKDLEEAKEWLRTRLGRLLPSHESAQVAARATASLPPDRATESLLLEKLKPWVEALRRQLFEKSEAPFDDVNAARPWLAKAWEFRQRPIPQMSDDDVNRYLELEERIEADREKLEDLQDAQLVLEYRTEQTPCWLPEEERKRRKPTGIRLDDLKESERTSLAARVLTGEVAEENVGNSKKKEAVRYRVFGRELRRISQATGFGRIGLADLVLTGRRPRLPSATIGYRGTTLGPERPHGGHRHSYLTIRLNSPLGYAELRRLHTRIRDIWKEAYEPPPDVRLLQMVAELLLGEGTKRFSRAGWKEVGAELERLGYRGKRDPRTLATRYKRRKGQVDY